MSFGAIWSGNLLQLRSSFGSKHSFKLPRFHSSLIPRKVVDARRCILQPIASKVEGNNQKSQSKKPRVINLNLRDGKTKSASNVNSNKSEIHTFKAAQCLNLQQNPDKKVFDWPATIIVFDIETTGFSHGKDRIIEIALRDLRGGKNSTFQTLVNPEKDVSNSKIHGITSNMVNRPDVPRFEELIPILIKFVRSRQIDGKPVLWIAHNGCRFDVPFVNREFNRCSVEIPVDWFYVDSLLLARQLLLPDGSKLASSKLPALREHYGVPLLGRAHRAMGDVEVLSSVFQKMTFDLKLTVPALMDQAKPFALQT